MSKKETTFENILAKVGLSSQMVWTSTHPNTYTRENFDYYCPPGYLTSQMHEVDEVYGISEVIFLHRKTGLRIAYTVTESYLGDKVKYEAHEVFIITADSKKNGVSDIDLERNVFISSNQMVAFSDVSKNIPDNE